MYLFIIYLNFVFIPHCSGGDCQLELAQSVTVIFVFLNKESSTRGVFRVEDIE